MRIKVRLYRIDTRNGGLQFCNEYTPEEFEAGDLPMIREQWGPGHYEIRVYGPKAIVTKGRVQIAPLANPSATAPVSAPSAESSAVAEMMRTLAEGQAALLAALTQRPDPAAEMMRTMELMRAMREAMGIGAAAPAPAPAAPVSQISEILAAFRELREASKEFAPGGDKPEEPSIMELGGKVVELVSTAMANRNAAPTGDALPPMAIPPSLAAPVDRSANPSTAGAAAAAPIPAGEAQEESVQILVLKGLFAGLIEKAAKGEPPEKGGEYIADKMPDELIQFIELPNWFDILSKFAWWARGDLATHREWLTKARDHAVQLLNEEGGEDGAA